jgi:hypothetical protein
VTERRQCSNRHTSPTSISRRRAATALALSPEHLALFLCAHGAKHYWERLGWICDVGRLLQVEKTVDWTGVFAEASETDTSRILSLGLLLARDLLGAEIGKRRRPLGRARRQLHAAGRQPRQLRD